MIGEGGSSTPGLGERCRPQAPGRAGPVPPSPSILDQVSAPRRAVPTELGGQPFLGAEAVRAGLVTPDQLRGPSFRPLLRGVHIAADAPESMAARAAAAGLVLPPDAVASHATAAYVHGADVAHRRAPVEATVVPPRTLLSRPGLLVRESRLEPDDVTEACGLAVTTPLRTAVDLGCTRDLVETVVGLDALLGTALMTMVELTEYAERFRGRRNIRRLRRAIELADGRAESPMETRLRLLLVLAGLPAPEVQFEVWQDGRFYGRLDLAYPALRLGIEFDGAAHDLAPRAAADLRRANGLLEIGWRLLRYDASDYYRRRGFIVRQVGTALLATA